LPVVHFRARDGDTDLGAGDEGQTVAGRLRKKLSQR
jgi:hypothetical protein